MSDPDKMNAVQCLEWLADKTGERNYSDRAKDWPGEVARFSAHESRDPDEWEAEATEELQSEVRRLMS